jgi:hypothetical protein
VKKKRSSSPPSLPSVTLNILSSSSPPIKTKKKRRSPQSIDDIASSSELIIPKLELQSSLVSPTYPISPIDTRNPVTWNVNDVCSYLNESGCSFALKTIKEQVNQNIHLVLFFSNHLFKEIDGAALLLLDDLPKVQDLLEFKLGPAVKFCHVVEQLRTQVIDTFHSSPSLKTSRLSTANKS